MSRVTRGAKLEIGASEVQSAQTAVTVEVIAVMTASFAGASRMTCAREVTTRGPTLPGIAPAKATPGVPIACVTGAIKFKHVTIPKTRRSTPSYRQWPRGTLASVT